MASQFKRYHHVPHWKGTVDDVAEIAGYVDGLVRGAVSTRWHVALPGVEDDFDETSKFVEAYGARELSQAERITLALRSDAPKPYVHISWTRISGLETSVRGEDAVLVDGLNQRLVARVDLGRRWSFALWVVWVVAGILAIALEGVLLLTLLEDSTVLALVTGLGAPIALLAATERATTYFMPRIEILADGEVTRWRRRQKAALAALGLLVLALIAPIFEKYAL